MNAITGISAASILSILAGIHVYWALGGQKWVDVVLPQASGSGTATDKVFVPSVAATLVVVLGLLAMAAVCLGIVYYKQSGQPPKALTFTGWAIASIFILRAIGEFNYVGFFKSVKDTAFAHNDTLIYSPLCVLLAALIITTIKS